MKIATALFAFALLAFACTTTTTAPDETADAVRKSNGGKADASTSDSSTSGDGGEAKDAGPPPAPSCEAETDQQACLRCCAKAQSAGYAFYQAAAQECACDPANCKQECADTACLATPDVPSDECQTCLEGIQETCAEFVASKCKADPGCVAYEQCAVASGCDQKL
jgi:hypothetical protein